MNPTSAGLRVYADSLNGRKWTTTALAAIKGDDLLFGLSCASAESCLAVGTSGVDWPYINTGIAYAEAWNGKIWSVKKVPTPPGSGSLADEGGSQLTSVQCLTATYCMAVGEAGTTPQGFSATWNNKAWKFAHAAA
jgi:hypothetical protein